MKYSILKSSVAPSLKGCWNEPAWKKAQMVNVDNFLARGSSHRPRTEVRALWNNSGIFIFFRVKDKYVRCLRTDYLASVWKDSCVEFFVEPSWGRGYFNFEINCGGTLLLYYLDYPDKKTGAIRIIEQVPARLAGKVRIYHSMPKIVYPEVKNETDWKIECFIPFALFKHYLGPLGTIGGQIWRCNFQKCADESSHPHWASWAPLHGRKSFHSPECFAPLHFVARKNAGKFA